MEYQCQYFQNNAVLSLFYNFAEYGPSGYTCQVVNIVKNSSASNATVITGEHLPGKSNNDVKRILILNQWLDAFPRNLHEKFPNLTILWIINCGLKKISKTDLIGFKNLESLNLDGNRLTSLPDDLFADVKKLQRIRFKDNKLERLSSNLLKPIETSLEYAYFLGNTKIDDYFDKNHKNLNLKRLMGIMDRLEPPLMEEETTIKPLRTTDRQLQKQKQPLPPPRTDSQSVPKAGADRQHEHHQQMIAKLTEFKVSGKFTDFTIKVQGKEFKVHKAILATQSPVFLETFTNEKGTAEKIFTKVKNFSEASFGSFLDFFYTGKVDEGVNALEVFEFASVFEVAILKSICAGKILAALSKSNALEVFNLAHHHDSYQLKQEAFKIIQKMFPEFPNRMVDNPDQVNKLIKAKREYEVMLKATKKFYSK